METLFKNVKNDWVVKTEIGNSLAVAVDKQMVYLFIATDESNGSHGAFCTMPKEDAHRLARQLDIQADTLSS